jgi:hypothetical protein
MILLLFSFLLAACSDSPVCYYLDATGGDDNNSGLAPDEAWKSLEKLRGVKLLPGNKVLLKRGEVFNGELEITGQGIPEDRIYIDAYGDDERKPSKASSTRRSCLMTSNNSSLEREVPSTSSTVGMFTSARCRTSLTKAVTSL